METTKLMQLSLLLGEWVEHIRSVDQSEESHPLVRASEVTIAFVNATIAHQGVKN